MNRNFKARLLAGALLLGASPFIVAAQPAQAEVSFRLSFGTFHHDLSPYGDWMYSDRWGTVWHPRVGRRFRPYTNGYWALTDDYGWTWVSYDPWGDIPYHYGRWVFDPDNGWLWIPGSVWGPGWVVWRSNGSYTGWMPMPPNDAFLDGDELSFDFGDAYYGYDDWYGRDYDRSYFPRLWVFIDNRHFGDRDARRYAVSDSRRVTDFIHQTHNVTNYTTINNYVVNRSVDVHNIERWSGRRIQPVRARDVIRQPALISRVDTGREAGAQLRQDVVRGKGHAQSAPVPDTTQLRVFTHKPVIPRNMGPGQNPAGGANTQDMIKQNRERGLLERGGTGPAGNNAMGAGGANTEQTIKQEREKRVLQQGGNGPAGNNATGAGGTNTEQTIKQEREKRLLQQGGNNPAGNNAIGPAGTTTDQTIKHEQERRSFERDNNPAGANGTMTPAGGDANQTGHKREERLNERGSTMPSGNSGPAGSNATTQGASHDQIHEDRTRNRKDESGGSKNATPPDNSTSGSGGAAPNHDSSGEDRRHKRGESEQ